MNSKISLLNNFLKIYFFKEEISRMNHELIFDLDSNDDLKQKVQVSDTTGDDKRFVVGNLKKV